MVLMLVINIISTEFYHSDFEHFAAATCRLAGLLYSSYIYVHSCVLSSMVNGTRPTSYTSRLFLSSFSLRSMLMPCGRLVKYWRLLLASLLLLDNKFVLHVRAVMISCLLLLQVVKERDITVNLRRNLIEVKPDTREAVFQNLDNPDDLKTLPVSGGRCLDLLIGSFYSIGAKKNGISEYKVLGSSYYS